MGKKIRRPSPALFIAMLALFVALAPAAEAVTSAASQVVRRALVANNALKLQGQNRAQVIAAAAARPGPASSAAALFTIKSQSVTVPANQIGEFQVPCDAGQRVVSGGSRAPNDVVIVLDSYPVNDTTWGVALGEFNSTPRNTPVTVYAVCVR